MGGTGKIIETIFELIIAIFIAYVLIDAFSQAFPGFAQYGWAVFSALIFGVIMAFRYGIPNLLK
jgi:hypothetical protein